MTTLPRDADSSSPQDAGTSTADLRGRIDPSSAQATEHVSWPATQLYWALLDLSKMGQHPARKRHQQLGYLFETLLPGIPIEDVQPAYQKLTNGGEHYIACGVSTEGLRRFTEQNPLASTLVPESLPDHLQSTGADPAKLNLLTGRFLPRHLVALRRRWLIQAAALLLLLAVVLMSGLERRRALVEATMLELEQRQATLVGDIVGRDGSPLPHHLRLTAHLRELEQTRIAEPEVLAGFDASDTLGALLAAWPQDIDTRVESASITSSSVTVRLTVPTMDDAQELADSLSAVSGWSLTQPRSEARTEGVHVTVRLEQEEGR